MSTPASTLVRRPRREWPLVVGMVVAAALVLGSTRVGASQNQNSPIPAVSQNAKQAAVTGFAAAAPAATSGTPAHAHTAKKHKHPAAAPRKPKKTSAAAPAPAAAAPSAHHTQKPTAQQGSDTGGAPAPAPSHAAPPKPQATAPAPAALAVPADSGQTTVGGVTFSVRAPSHTPTAGQDWTVAITAARGAKALAGKVQMDVVYQGKVVGHVTTKRLAADGSFSKKIVWPARSVGYPLTLRVKLWAGGQHCTFLYDVKIQAAG